MNGQKNVQLKDNYLRMSDDEILDRVAEGKSKYTEDAYGLLLDEAKRRNIEDLINKPKELRPKAKMSENEVDKVQIKGKRYIGWGSLVLLYGLIRAVLTEGFGVGSKSFEFQGIFSFIGMLVAFTVPLGLIALFLFWKGKKLLADKNAYRIVFNLLLTTSIIGVVLYIYVSLRNYIK